MTCGSGNARHWFTVRGCPGMKRPDCDRCGKRRRYPLTPAEQSEFDYAVSRGWTRP